MDAIFLAGGIIVVSVIVIWIGIKLRGKELADWKMKQVKINHGIMPFWIDATREEAEEIGFEVLEEREIKQTNVLWKKGN